MPTFYAPIILGAGNYLDFQKDEARNMVVQNLASAPSGQKGQLYFDSALNVLFWHNGTTWVSASGANPATTVTTQAVGDAAVVGTAVTYAREDHKHGREAFGGTVVAETTFSGAASAVGTALTVAHSDHTHGTPAAAAFASIPLSALGVPTAAINMNNFAINGLPTSNYPV